MGALQVMDKQAQGLLSQEMSSSSTQAKEYVTMRVEGQLFGITVGSVQDVLNKQHVTRIPLAPQEIEGSLNLRGRIVTAINVRRRLKLPPQSEKVKKPMSVVVEHKSELYSLIVDSVGDVLSLSSERFEKNPANLDGCWREVSSGVYRLKDELLVVLDIATLLKI